jgi:hypothetical protein
VLIKRRGGHKGVVTQLMKSLDQMLNVDPPDNEGLQAGIMELKRQLDYIVSYDDQIVMKLKDEDLMKDMVESSDYVMAVTKMIAKVEYKLSIIHSNDVPSEA